MWEHCVDEEKSTGTARDRKFMGVGMGTIEGL